jgi:hypothetical protein
MENYISEYQSWIEKLGWVTPEMLCLLTRGISRAELPGGRDHRLERFLSGSVRDGKLFTRYIEGQPVYGSSTRNHNKSTNTYHDLMAAQAAVKLWLAFQSSKLLFTPGHFFARNSTVIPDFGLTVTLLNGVHGFALEYQTFRESNRTTQTKIGDYWKHFEDVRQIMDADFLWVIFILERDPGWVEEMAQTFTHSFIYLIDTATFLHTSEISSESVFLAESGKHVSLIAKK